MKVSEIMKNKPSSQECKKLEVYSSEIIALQYKVDEISRLLKEINQACSDETKNHSKRGTTLSWQISQKSGTGIANVLNITYEECTKLPTEDLLKRLIQEKVQSTNIAVEKLQAIATVSKSLLHLANIRNKK